MALITSTQQAIPVVTLTQGSSSTTWGSHKKTGIMDAGFLFDDERCGLAQDHLVTARADGNHRNRYAE